MIQRPVPFEIYQQGFMTIIGYFSSNVKTVFLDKFDFLVHIFQTRWFYYVVGTLVIVYASVIVYYLLNYSRRFQFVQNPRISIITYSKNYIFSMYRWLGKIFFPNLPWVNRDLLIMERIIKNTKLPHSISLVFPPALSSLLGLSFVLLSLHDYSSFVLTIWFICWFALSQTIWLWLWSYPILHPSSELRQIDLVKLSPKYSINQFMNTKMRLIMILLIPLQCVINGVLIVGVFLLNGSFMQLLVGIIGSWLLFFISAFISTVWMKFCSRFDYPNLFMVRIDTYESKFVHQSFMIPKRMLNAGLCIVFLLGILSILSRGRSYSMIFSSSCSFCGVLRYFFSIILPGTKNIRMGIAFMNGKMKMGVFKYYWQTYSTKSILIILVFIASFLWGMISQSYQNPLVISSPNLTWMDYFFHNTKQAFLTILLGFVTYGFGSLALGAISGISAGVGIEITLQNNMGESIITAFLPHAIFEIPAI